MRNFLRIGDRVEMVDGAIFTIKSLEYRTFIAIEEIGYQSKKDIKRVI